jgi:hypothetical protein
MSNPLGSRLKKDKLATLVDSIVGHPTATTLMTSRPSGATRSRLRVAVWGSLAQPGTVHLEPC